MSLLLVFGLNAENPSVEYAVQHDQEDAKCRRHRGARPRLREVALRKDVKNGSHVDADKNADEDIF